MSASSLFPDLPATAPGGSGSSASFGATQSLYRKYRPQTFESDELVGQDAIIRTLKNAIKLDRVAHAYLFTGPRGTGKTTTARLLAKAVNCLADDPDVRPCNVCAACVAINTGATTDIIEIDAASNRGIDDIRELRERVKFAPTFLKTKFYIVDEAHQITGAAANAFLKTLEEPPRHTKFILATTDPEQLLATIVSRCQRFDFKRFSRDITNEHLARIAELEHIPIESDALRVISEHAGGSMRDALGLLDQLASYRDHSPDGGTRVITAEDVRSLLGIARGERVIRIARALAEADAGLGLELINSAFESGEDPRQLNRQLVNLLRAVMFQVAAREPGADAEINELAQLFSLDVIALHAARFSEIDYRIRHASLPQLPLEIAFVQATLDANPRRAVAPARTAAQETPRPPAHSHDSDSSSLPTPPDPIANGPQRASAPEPQPTEMRDPAPVKEQPSARPRASVPNQPSAPSSASGNMTVDLLHDLWPKIRLDIKARDRRIEALLSSCDPMSVSGSSITLVTSYKFHLEKMNEDAARELIESVIGRLVGQVVSVKTEMRGASPAPIGNGRELSDEPPASNRPDPPAAETPPFQAAPEPHPDQQTIIDAARNIFDAEELNSR